jgi:3-dehydroquinate dehydratase/shikimate dehydrogenase
MATAIRAGNRRATVTATLTNRVAVTDLPAGVSDLEIRADLTGDIDPRPLRGQVPGRLVYSLRSTSRGGNGPDSPDRRMRRLLEAACHYDVVDLEAPHDLRPELLARIPAQQRRVSWHGPPLGVAALRGQFDRMADVPAHLYLLAPAIATFEQALAPLRFLARLGRRDVTAFGTGPAGTWSRLVAPWLGAPVVFGRLHPHDTLGVPTVRALLTDYPFPELPAIDRLYGIAGARAAHSLSPRLHNAALRRLGLPGLFLPFPTDEIAYVLAELTSGLAELGLPLCGLTVAAPNKETVLTIAAGTSAGAGEGHSANILVPAEEGWYADSTDGTAVIAALDALGVDCREVAAAVIGCGGAGRAAAVELVRAGADVTLVNRGVDRGQFAHRILGLPVIPLASFAPAQYQVVVHATPLHDEVPFATDELTPGTVVLDFVYRDRVTALMASCRERGLTTVDGWEVLLGEVRRQFRLMTGATMPDNEDPDQGGTPSAGMDDR